MNLRIQVPPASQVKCCSLFSSTAECQTFLGFSSCLAAPLYKFKSVISMSASPFTGKEISSWPSFNL
jgi:hypothetical protein